jgi:5-(carboxyamino)imidazole ribonucleotide synthase
MRDVYKNYFMRKIQNPVAHIGIIGGGQLGRMMAMAARRMGCAISVIDPTPDSPAGQLADQQIVAGFDDQEAMRSLVEACDVTTFEIETIDVTGLIELEATGHAIYPSPLLLAQLQDKLLQKELLKEADLPTAAFIDAGELSAEIFADFGYPLVQKARRGGYDGRGVAVLKTKDDFENHLPVPSYIESYVTTEKELSVLVARSRDGSSRCYPVVEMTVLSEQNVLDTLVSPARVSDQIALTAEMIAKRAINEMEGVGVFGVEMFLTENEEILINEIAPRTHNSGHHTIEACVTDQFEQHLRAVMGLPLGSVEQLSPAVMLNLLGAPGSEGAVKLSGLAEALMIPGVSVHLYGKAETRPYRKMGHATILNQNLEIAEQIAEKLRDLITIAGENEHG